MDDNIESELEPNVDSELKAAIDQTWLKLHSHTAGGGTRDGRLRNDN